MRPLLGYSPSRKRKLKPDAVPTLNLNSMNESIQVECSEMTGVYYYFVRSSDITHKFLSKITQTKIL